MIWYLLSILTSPLEGKSSKPEIFSNEVFPVPEGATIPINSDFLIFKFILLKITNLSEPFSLYIFDIPLTQHKIFTHVSKPRQDQVLQH